MLKNISIIFVTFIFSFCLIAADSNPSEWKGPLYRRTNDNQAGWARPFLEKIPLEGHERILDLGCGDGKNTAWLFNKIHQGKVVGSDKSPSMIGAAQSYAEGSDGRLSFVVQDMTEQGFEAESFDIIVSTTALHWVENQDAVLKNAHYYLGSGGQIYFLIPSRCDLFFQLTNTFSEMRMSAKYEDYLKHAKPQVFNHKPDDYTTLLITNGFRLNSLLLRPKENTFASCDSFSVWLNSWLFAEFSAIPKTMRDEFLQDFISTYMRQDGAVDSEGKIHYYGYLMEIEATKR
jgi:trans-aconitate methyltransferase